MVIPEILRERVLNNLRRQRTITDDAVLLEMVDATSTGRLTNRADVKAFIGGRGLIVSTGWVGAQCKYLQEIWSFLNPATAPPVAAVAPSSTALVTTSTLTLAAPTTFPLAPEVLPPPPPPPTSMVLLTDAMRECWYRGVDLPLIAPSTNTLGDTIPFDRNDLYCTNETALRELLEYGALPREQRELDHSLVFVKLSTGERKELREYITWCERRDLRTFASHINNHQVRCNDHVSHALNKGARFRCVPICDEVGFVRWDELDDMLYLLEGYMDGYGTRYPAGLNPREVPHMLHRSLNQMGGNRGALRAYAQWQEAVKRTLTRVAKVDTLIAESRGALRACQEWETRGTDFDLAEAFCVKWETKAGEADIELARAEREQTNVIKARRVLAGKIVDALTDAYVKSPYMTPTRLLELRATLQDPEPDHVKSVRVGVSELQRIIAGRGMSVRNALIELEIWDGKARMPFFCRETVNHAFRRITLRTHPDKNNNVEQQELPQQFKDARNCLHSYLNVKEGGGSA